MAKDWMKQYMNPSQKDFMSWMRGQTAGQYNPLIGKLKDQIVGMAPEKDFMVKAYQSLIGAQPSQESIKGAYQTSMADLAKYIQGVNTTQGAQGVSDIVGSIGAGLGVSPGVSADLAQAAGTLSGVGEAGGNVMSQAILGGAMGTLRGQELQALQGQANQAQQLMLGLGQSQEEAKKGQRAAVLQLAELQGKKAAGRMNPFDIANAMMSFSKNQKALADYLRGSSGGGGINTPKTPTGGGGNGFDPAKLAAAMASSGLQGVSAQGWM